MNTLFASLVVEERIGIRQRNIRAFLNSADLTDFLPKGGRILPEIAVRAGHNEGIFVVGEEYCSSGKYEHGHEKHKHHPLYLLGIVQIPGKENGLLIIEPSSSKSPAVVQVWYLDENNARATIPYAAQPA